MSKITKVLAQHVSKRDTPREWTIDPAEDLVEAGRNFQKVSGLVPKEYGYQNGEDTVLIRFDYPKPKMSRLN